MSMFRGHGSKPTVALDEVICGMIAAHVGKPCPPAREVMEWTGLPRRRIWPYIEGMAARSIIELERMGKEGPRVPIRRRMRVLAHAYTAATDWTLWTAEGLTGNPNWMKEAAD